MRRSTPEQFGYGPAAGYAPLRAALAGYLARARGLSCEPGQIVIVNGSQQAFDLVARVILDPDDAVVVEEPGYHGSRATFEAAGARLIPIEVDESGLDTGKLPPASAGVQLCCVTPCHQFPTGVIMSLNRRLALLGWAQRTGAWVLEDDYVSEFRYEGRPIEALHGLDASGRVIYVGTFSKVLYPALRLAYLVLPTSLVETVVAAKWVTDRYSAMLGQEALADFIASGAFERYLRRACTRNAARRQALIASLKEHLGDQIEIGGSNAGVHLLVWLKGYAASRVTQVIDRAARAGVGVYPINSCYVRGPSKAGLLFGYASLTTSEIRSGVRRFAGIL
jgi:GntR family transcriptional regulator/MocR family aminotransferase